MAIAFEPKKTSLLAQTLPTALISSIALCAYLYFIRGETRTLLYIALTALVIVLTLGFHLLRSHLGQVNLISLNEEALSIERKNETLTFAWPEITKVLFETLNSVPWLVIEANGKKAKCCLQSFSDVDQHSLIEAIKAKYSGEVISKNTVVTTTTSD